MARPLAVLLATALAGASFAGAKAQTFLPWDLPPQPHPVSYFYSDHYDDGRHWRRYPPNYGAETFPGALGALVDGPLTNPCFLGGCHFYPGDLDYAASWGSVDPDPGATGRAFRALSRVADRMAAKETVYPVMVEPGSRAHARHRAHKPQVAPAPQQP